MEIVSVECNSAGGKIRKKARRAGVDGFSKGESSGDARSDSRGFLPARMDG